MEASLPGRDQKQGLGLFWPMILFFHQESALSGRDLVRMRAELLRQIGQRLHSSHPGRHQAETPFIKPIQISCAASSRRQIGKLLWFAMRPGRRISGRESRHGAHAQSAESLQPARQQKHVRTASLNNVYLPSYLYQLSRYALVRFRFAMRVFLAVPLAAALGTGALLTGCTREPPSHPAAKPIMLQPRAAAQVRARPAPALPARALSADEKQRLFQAFTASQSFKDQTVTTQEATP